MRASLRTKSFKRRSQFNTSLVHKREEQRPVIGASHLFSEVEVGHVPL